MALPLLIDVDSLVYKAGFSSQYELFVLAKEGEVISVKGRTSRNLHRQKGWELIDEKLVVEPPDIAILALGKALQHIIQGANPSTVEIALGDPSSNWRHDLTKEYKANRSQPKPIHFDIMMEWVVSKFTTVEEPHMEADDVLADLARDYNYEVQIAGIDKDLLQIPGWHLNYMRGTTQYISPIEGELHFYTQILTGDASDNIPGLWKVGPQKAGKILADANTDEDMWWAVLCAYEKAEEEVPYDEIVKRGQLLRLGRELWRPPNVS
jgi:5'-3' exonuclease